MLSGLALLLPSLWLLIVAELTHSMPLLLCATALGGLSAALGYRGSLEEANRIAPSEQRSEVVSSYLIAVYGGNSVPIIGIGLLAAITSSTTAHVSFAAIITALAEKIAVLAPEPLRRPLPATTSQPAYPFSRRSVARSCSSASRSQILAISKRSVLPWLPAGKVFAIL